MSLIRWFSIHRGSRAPHAWSLRWRVIASALLVVLLIAGMTGAAATVLLRQYLTEEVDHRLRTMMPRLSPAIAPGTTGGYAPPQFIHSRQPPDTIGAIVSNGEIAAAGYNGDSGEERGLSISDAERLATASATPTPQTVQLSIGHFRIVSTQVGQSTVLLGYSLEPVEAATTRLAITAALLLLLGTVVALPMLYALVKSALKPLTRLERAAQTVTPQSLASASVDEARQGLASSGESAEVVRLAQAMDTMLVRVKSSLTERDQRTQQLRRFIGDVSHELRTPLAIVQGYTEFAQRVDAPDPLPALLDRVAEGGARLRRLVEDMLALTRIEAREDVRLEEVDVIDLLHGRVCAFERWHPEITWDRVGSVESWRSQVDVPRLARAFDEILHNAADYSDERHHVLVRRSVAGARLHITITNTVRGTDPILGDTAFEPFVAGDASRARIRTGTGLGLTIARAAIDLHGGTITMHVEPEQVSVTLTLPAADPAALVAASSLPPVIVQR